jgi:hypothetical protein
MRPPEDPPPSPEPPPPADLEETVREALHEHDDAPDRRSLEDAVRRRMRRVDADHDR